MVRVDMVKKHIDLKIMKNLSDGSFDSTRDFLFEKHIKFKKIADIDDLPLSDDDIDSIKDTKTRYLTRYVHHSKKRIIDLYRIERSFRKLNSNQGKIFLLLLFKERMEGKINYNILDK